jgi:hypothetical protein
MNEDKHNFLRALITPATAVAASELAVVPASESAKFIDSTMKADALDKVLIKKLIKGNPDVKVYRREGNLDSHVGFDLRGRKGIQIASCNATPAIAAHELGHHKIFSGLGLGASGATNLYKFTSGVAPSIGMLGAGIAAYNDDTKNMAPYIVAGGFAPQVFEEAAASLIGTKDLIRHAGFLKGMQKGMRMLPSFLTYLAKPVGAYFAAKKVMDVIE